MLVDEIQNAIKSSNVIIGYRRSIKFIKTNKPKIVVIAKNIPEEMRKEVESSVKVSGLKLEVFDGSSKDLGILCGKPFPITTVTIKG